LAKSWQVGRLEAAEAGETDIAALSGTQTMRVAADKIFIWPSSRRDKVRATLP